MYVTLSMVQYPTLKTAGDLPAAPSSPTTLLLRATLHHDCVQAARGVVLRAGGGGVGCAGCGAWAGGGGLKVSQVARAAAQAAAS